MTAAMFDTERRITKSNMISVTHSDIYIPHRLYMHIYVDRC